jgi:hypothetical protein
MAWPRLGSTWGRPSSVRSQRSQPDTGGAWIVAIFGLSRELLGRRAPITVGDSLHVLVMVMTASSDWIVTTTLGTGMPSAIGGRRDGMGDVDFNRHEVVPSIPLCSVSILEHSPCRGAQSIQASKGFGQRCEMEEWGGGECQVQEQMQRRQWSYSKSTQKLCNNVCMYCTSVSCPTPHCRSYSKTSWTGPRRRTMLRRKPA